MRGLSGNLIYRKGNSQARMHETNQVLRVRAVFKANL